MKITESIIKSYTDEIIFKRGVNYYNNGKVTDFKVIVEQHPFYKNKSYKINAYIQSSFGSDVYYNTIIEFNDLTGFNSFDCNCEIFNSESKNKGICKHMVAALIKFAKEYQNGEKQIAAVSMTESLVSDLRNSYINNSTFKTPLNLNIKYCYHASEDITSSIELSVGLSKLYVVKNMKDFLETIDKGGCLEFGKGFTFNGREHCFMESNQPLIDFLLEVYELENLNSYSNSLSPRRIKLISGRKVYLPGKQLNKFFQLIIGLNISASILNCSYEDVSIQESDIPLKFDLKLVKEDIFLVLKDGIARPLNSKGEYFFHNGSIYKPSKNQIKIYLPIYNALIKEKTNYLTFQAGDIEPLASYIIPCAKNISSELNITPQLKNLLIEEPLKIQIFLDNFHGNITADLIYCYGNTKINPISQSPVSIEDGYLVRDMSEELTIETLLTGFGFEKNEQCYVLKEDKKLLDFLNYGINNLQNMAEVYYSEPFKRIKVYTTTSYTSSVRLNDENLLELSFEIEDVDRDELKYIFQALKEKKKYYRLLNGSFINLDNEKLLKISNLLDYIDFKEHDFQSNSSIRLKKHNIFYLEECMKNLDEDFVFRDTSYTELVNQIKNIDEGNHKLTEFHEKIMRSYQKTGFAWLKTLSSHGLGGILADEMGLGKTLQAISFLNSEVDDIPSLVIAPTSLIYNWKLEFEKYAPEMKVLVIKGSKGERDSLITNINNFNVIITSYPLIRKDIDLYSQLKFKYCILDEAQHIKNPGSQNATSVKQLKADCCFALTGTPIENSLSELWSIFDFILPGYLFNYSKFVDLYELPISKHKDKAALEELNKHIMPFILRRYKKDVIKELPPKIEHKIVVEMTDEQKLIYASYVTSLKEEVDNEIIRVGFNKSRIKILSVLTRLRQICLDPSVFIENYNGESCKYLALEELLEESISEGHRVLLFSQFTSILKNISKRLEKSEIEHMYLDGQSKSEERIKMVERFNKGQAKVFLISLKAGGTGLNLTGADLVIHFDPWWNPAVEEQATDRAHRIGQKKTVEVIKLIAKGTIEEKIYALHEKKKEIIENVLSFNLHENSLLPNFSQEEIDELFYMDL